MFKKSSIISIISFWVLIIVPFVLEAWMFDRFVDSPQKIEDSFWRDDENKTCKSALPCNEDKDCGDGTCGGIRTCQCRCTEKTLCTTPVITPLANTLVDGKIKKCGGLKNACNETTNKCECNQAYKNEGFKNTGDAILKLCLGHSCKSDDDCHGMTCLPGFCTCPK
ncbi:hypothetical protein ACQ4LE_004395 [Meloidogyne hapla]|uniref:EB domain-containing protein n=1 Tax=Meloidogyne hapla TaxID=6305 RepID=A0A1I8BPL6_MELHA